MGLIEDERFMRRAFAWARRGVGKVSPNPMVGAVLVSGGLVVASGYHSKFGGPHAEINVLQKVEAGKRKVDFSRSVLYVNLEPCCFHGKTPACTDAIIRAGIGEVVIAMQDPNPRVSGAGIRALRLGGARVRVGVLESEARALNIFFMKYMETGLPYVTLKIACTIDGKIAKTRGIPARITSLVSRKAVHRMRASYDAILTSTGTVLADDPHLGVRYVRGRDPLRVIVGNRRLPSQARVFRDENYVLYGRDVGFGGILRELAGRGVTSVLVEGGQQFNDAWILSGLVDDVQIDVAPKFFGPGALSAWSGSFLFHLNSLRQSGNDVVLCFR